MSDIKPIETRYAGYRFRSRLEARWAVFFDHLGAAWEYEPQGFVINGAAYLPDFLLTDCGTWVEVKGSEGSLNEDLMAAAAESLPFTRRGTGEAGPRLLILGPIPEPLPRRLDGPSGDWGWVGLDSFDEPGLGCGVEAQWWGFGSYHEHRCPCRLSETSTAPHWGGDSPTLTPVADCYVDGARANAAYEAARSARFEHGEAGPR